MILSNYGELHEARRMNNLRDFLSMNTQRLVIPEELGFVRVKYPLPAHRLDTLRAES